MLNILALLFIGTLVVYLRLYPDDMIVLEKVSAEDLPMNKSTHLYVSGQVLVHTDERTQTVTQSDERTQAVTQSDERTQTVTQSDERTQAVTQSYERTQAVTQSDERTQGSYSIR